MTPIASLKTPRPVKVSLLALTMCLVPMLAQTPNWTDRQEYDLVLQIRSESIPQKRLSLLDGWTKAYPKTELKKQRLELYLATYENLRDVSRMADTARRLLTADPSGPVGLYWVTVLAPEQSEMSKEQLELSEKSARTLQAKLDQFFAPEARPSSVSAADWQKQKLSVDVIAQRTIGWVAWQRGDFAGAAMAFSDCLKKDPDNAEISSWLGIVSGLDKDQQIPALWHLAYATNNRHEPLAEEQKHHMSNLLEHMYVSYHGSAEGLDQLEQNAAVNPFPPSGFAIDSSSLVAARRAEAELSKTNPELAAWMAIRRQLDAADGEKYFGSDLQGKPLPRLRGTVLRSSGPRSARQVTLAMTEAGSPDVVLKVATPLSLLASPGQKVLFSSTGETFTKEPFTLVVTASYVQIERARPASAR